MEKSTLKHTILTSYQSSLIPNDYVKLESVLNKLSEESKDVTEMAMKFNNLEEYKLLHEAYLRERAEKTNNSASTIKVIVVVYFICSIISALYVFTRFLM